MLQKIGDLRKMKFWQKGDFLAIPEKGKPAQKHKGMGGYSGDGVPTGVSVV